MNSPTGQPSKPLDGPSQARVCAVVVNYNAGQWLSRCVVSLASQPEVSGILVWDNASSDSSLHGLEQAWQAKFSESSRLADLQIIRSKSNLGFGAGCNAAVAHLEAQTQVDTPTLEDPHSPSNTHPQHSAQLHLKGSENRGSADFLLFLNPDCEATTGAVGRLLNAWQNHFGALGGGVLNADGSIQASCARGYPSLSTQLKELSGKLPNAIALARDRLAKAAARRPRPTRESPDVRSQPEGTLHAELFSNAEGTTPANAPELATQTAVVVPAVSGACMLMRTGTFKQLGGFDEFFKLHFEDLDLCRRIEKAGLVNACLPEALFVHQKGLSSSGRPLWVEWHKHLGMFKFMKRHPNLYSTSERIALGVLTAGRFLVHATKAVVIKAKQSVLRRH